MAGPTASIEFTRPEFNELTGWVAGTHDARAADLSGTRDPG